MPDFDPMLEGTQFAIMERRQNREEAALETFKKDMARVLERYLPEIDSQDPDLSQRATMAASVLAMIKNAPTYQSVREGMKQLQGIFGHSVAKQVTHTHLTLEARVTAGIEQVRALGLLPESPTVVTVDQPERPAVADLPP